MCSAPSVISLCAGHNALRLRKDASSSLHPIITSWEQNGLLWIRNRMFRGMVSEATAGERLRKKQFPLNKVRFGAQLAPRGLQVGTRADESCRDAMELRHHGTDAQAAIRDPRQVRHRVGSCLAPVTVARMGSDWAIPHRARRGQGGLLEVMEPE